MHSQIHTVERALSEGIPVIRYHKFLGEYMDSFTNVAITGAHGKTSTTGLLACVMQKRNLTT